jgi:transposase InsO family protein
MAGEGLEHLPANTRNVKFKGIKRIKCESCSVSYAARQVSRRVSENRSPRPFYRISWDLFNYLNGYDGTKWLLVIKDKYSGKLFIYPLSRKTMEHVFSALRRFERWVYRQYGVYIYFIKHDSNILVMGINPVSETEYVEWTKELGIEIDLTPSYTSVANGGGERVGREVIERGVRLLD